MENDNQTILIESERQNDLDSATENSATKITEANVTTAGRVLSIIGMVLGILGANSSISAWIPPYGIAIGFPSFVISLVGLILSNVAKKAGGVPGMNKAGTICGIIGVISYSIVLFLYIVLLVIAAVIGMQA